ncbi:hypothetical protein IT407_04380 [Candidatus Uhrbacteria bacterium]|nr:hypothetical protein [Candidatus Uhrbacteria bacterium]
MKNLTLALALGFAIASIGCARPYPPVITGGAGVSAYGYVGVGGMGGIAPGSTGAISPYGGSLYSETSADPRTAYAVAAYDQARLAARSSSYAVAAVPVPPVVGGTCVGTSCPLPPESERADSGGDDSDLVRGLVDQTLANTEAIDELRERLDD